MTISTSALQRELALLQAQPLGPTRQVRLDQSFALMNAALQAKEPQDVSSSRASTEKEPKQGGTAGRTSSESHSSSNPDGDGGVGVTVDELHSIEDIVSVLLDTGLADYGRIVAFLDGMRYGAGMQAVEKFVAIFPFIREVLIETVENVDGTMSNEELANAPIAASIRQFWTDLGSNISNVLRENGYLFVVPQNEWESAYYVNPDTTGGEAALNRAVADGATVYSLNDDISGWFIDHPFQVGVTVGAVISEAIVTGILAADGVAGISSIAELVKRYSAAALLVTVAEVADEGLPTVNFSGEFKPLPAENPFIINHKASFDAFGLEAENIHEDSRGYLYYKHGNDLYKLETYPNGEPIFYGLDSDGVTVSPGALGLKVEGGYIKNSEFTGILEESYSSPALSHQSGAADYENTGLNDESATSENEPNAVDNEPNAVDNEPAAPYSEDLIEDIEAFEALVADPGSKLRAYATHHQLKISAYVHDGELKYTVERKATSPSTQSSLPYKFSDILDLFRKQFPDQSFGPDNVVFKDLNPEAFNDVSRGEDKGSIVGADPGIIGSARPPDAESSSDSGALQAGSTTEQPTLVESDDHVPAPEYSTRVDNSRGGLTDRYEIDFGQATFMGYDIIVNDANRATFSLRGYLYVSVDGVQRQVHPSGLLLKEPPSFKTDPSGQEVANLLEDPISNKVYQTDLYGNPDTATIEPDGGDYVPAPENSIPADNSPEAIIKRYNILPGQVSFNEFDIVYDNVGKPVFSSEGYLHVLVDGVEREAHPSGLLLEEPLRLKADPSGHLVPAFLENPVSEDVYKTDKYGNPDITPIEPDGGVYEPAPEYSTRVDNSRGGLIDRYEIDFGQTTFMGYDIIVNDANRATFSLRGYLYVSVDGVPRQVHPSGLLSKEPPSFKTDPSGQEVANLLEDPISRKTYLTDLYGNPGITPIESGGGDYVPAPEHSNPVDISPGGVIKRYNLLPGQVSFNNFDIVYDNVGKPVFSAEGYLHVLVDGVEREVHPSGLLLEEPLRLKTHASGHFVPAFLEDPVSENVYKTDEYGNPDMDVYNQGLTDEDEDPVVGGLGYLTDWDGGFYP